MTGIESAKLKLARAAEHIKTIEHYARQYARSKPAKVARAGGKERVKIRCAPPDEISVIAGEALHQLRSALDHLAFDLVQLNAGGTPLPHNWERKCLFPLLTDAPKKAPSYNCFEKRLPNISKAAFAVIEGMQPYHGIGLRNRITTPKVLGWLAELSNIDKHRHLNITVANLTQREVRTSIDGRLRISYARAGLKHGVEIQPGTLAQESPTKLTRRFTVYVAFDEPKIEDGTLFSVQKLLQECLSAIKRDIVPAFYQLMH